MFINIDLVNIKEKNSLTWFQQNYIRHKYNIFKSLSYIDLPTPAYGTAKNGTAKNGTAKNGTAKKEKKILLTTNMPRIIPNTPHTTPRKELLSMFDDNSGWNTLKMQNSTQTTTIKKEIKIPSSMRISIDRLDYQSPGRLDNISNSSNSTLNSSMGDRLSNLTSPYLSSSSPQNKNKSSSSSNSFDTF